VADVIHADAVVIGAGCAGLSAAVRLAERGARVVLVEQAPRLGGRAATFEDRATGDKVDNGQHVLFGCYTETYRLLETLGVADRAPLARSLDLWMAGGFDGRSHRLHCPDLPAPWHLVVGLLTWSAVPVGARMAALRLRALLDDAMRRPAAAVAADVDPSWTVTDWLTAHGQPAAMRRWLWHPLTYAALNQGPDDAAARPFVRVLAEMFGGGAEGASVGLPRVPLDQLFAAPAAAFLRDRGAVLLEKRPARVIAAGERIASVKVGDTTVRAGVVISAVPWHGFAALWDEAVPPAVADIARHAASMRATPIVSVNLWFDRAVLDRDVPFVGVSDGTVQWIFGRQAITGGGRHVSAVTSGAGDILRLDNEALIDRALTDVLRVLPAARRARLERALPVREPRAGFSLAPGSPPRPGPRTAMPELLLAGDWTDTGLPATIESAVRSGVTAAALIT
jgi:squalene-associated FAD-dependent desaturase